METISVHGILSHTYGSVPETGSIAPRFTLTDDNFENVSSDKYKGKRMVLNIFPSLDTSVCAASVRRFNAEAAGLKNTQVLCISMDLPFAQKRFCTAEGIDDLKVLSSFRSDFGKQYGLLITDGMLAGLLARAVIVTDESHRIIYTGVVKEISSEPDYEAALSALK